MSSCVFRRDTRRGRSRGGLHRGRLRGQYLLLLRIHGRSGQPGNQGLGGQMLRSGPNAPLPRVILTKTSHTGACSTARWALLLDNDRGLLLVLHLRLGTVLSAVSSQISTQNERATRTDGASRRIPVQHRIMCCLDPLSEKAGLCRITTKRSVVERLSMLPIATVVCDGPHKHPLDTEAYVAVSTPSRISVRSRCLVLGSFPCDLPVSVLRLTVLRLLLPSLRLRR